MGGGFRRIDAGLLRLPARLFQFQLVAADVAVVSKTFLNRSSPVDTRRA
jgi:hypothetical protein